MLECIIGILSEFREVLVGGYVCGKERQGQVEGWKQRVSAKTRN